MGVWIETVYPHRAYRHSGVTPCVGVWIETRSTGEGREDLLSHPAWVCGLKLLCQTFQTSACVTPCVGVWIETRGLRELTAASVVTPCVGVWIETSILQQRVNLPLLSHPAWVCGLKHILNTLQMYKKVTPCVGVWIETMTR